MNDKNIEKIVMLFDVGDSPDDITINARNDSVDIYVKEKHVMKLMPVDVSDIKIERNRSGKVTDIEVEDIMISIQHKKGYETVEEIEATRPICPKCRVRTDLVDGTVFEYIYVCPKCGDEIVE